MVGVAVPYIDHDRDMVVPVQENQWLLAENDEHRIAEFVCLRYDESVCPEFCWTIEIRRAEKDTTYLLFIMSSVSQRIEKIVITCNKFLSKLNDD